MRASYPTYKSTSIPWPDSIPESWELVKISSVFRERRETVSDKDFAPLSVTMQGIVPQLETAAKTDNGDNRKKVCAGDFVINSRSDRKGSAGISHLDGSVSVISIVLKPLKRLNERYVNYLLTNYYFQEEFYRYGKGIVADLWSTKYSSMKGMFIPLPSLEEQTAIANYLDAKTEQINRFIAKKEKLIALLKEQKQAVINELLEDKEGKWERMKLKFVSNVNKLSLGEKTNPEFEFTYLDISSVDEGGNQSETIQKIKFKDAPSRARRVVRKGDVIISTVRTYLQSITFFDSEVEDIIVSTGYAVLTPRQKAILPEFLNFAVRKKEVLDEIMANSTGITYPAITSIKLSNFKISVPSIDEQLEIIKQINTETNRILTVIGRIEREIEIVKELKQSLIAEVVTGRIKVA